MANVRLIQLIRVLVAEEKLEPGTALHAIAWKVAREGYDVLTPGQQFVFRRRIMPLLANEDSGVDLADCE